MGAAHARRSATSLRRADTAERQHERKGRPPGRRASTTAGRNSGASRFRRRGAATREAGRPAALECCSITMGCSGSPVSFSNAGRSMFWRTFPGAPGPNSSACGNSRQRETFHAHFAARRRDLRQHLARLAGLDPAAVHQHVDLPSRRSGGTTLVAGPSVPQLVVEVDRALVDEAASGCDVLHDVASRIDSLGRNFERRPLESPIELCAERALLVRAACLASGRARCRPRTPPRRRRTPMRAGGKSILRACATS